MSNSHEPSYYEIALTNRQVVVAFVILLACLLTAFFSGVWVGRGSSEREAPTVVRQAPPEPTEGADLQELEFFEQEGEEPGPGAAVAQKPAPETTLQEDLAGRTRAEPSGPPAPAAPEPLPEQRAEDPPPEPGRRTEEPLPRASEPAPPPVPARPVPAAEPAPRQPAAREAAEPATGSVVIQVFASTEKAEAQRILDRLAQGGQSAYLSPVTVEGRTMFRVRIGPFGSRDEAQQVAERVRKTYRLDTWVTQ